MKKTALGAAAFFAIAATAWWFFGNRPVDPEPASQPPADTPAPTTPAATPPGPPPPVLSPAALPRPPRTNTAAAPPEPSPPASPAAAARDSKTTPKPRTQPGPLPPVPAPSAVEDPAVNEVSNIALNIRNFGRRFNGNPVGSNAEIVEALRGANPAGVHFLPEDQVRLNDEGELLDRWGTPYFFHSLSETDTEVRSAGPDKVMWTDDDILAQ